MNSLQTILESRWTSTCGLIFRRGLGLTAYKQAKESSTPEEEFVDPEEEELKQKLEQEIEKKRNKSGLHVKDYRLFHGQIPHSKPLFDFHERLTYKRRMFGRYGWSSGVDPVICWPSKEELEDARDYEKVAHPYSFQELVERMKQKKEEETAILEARKAEVLKNYKNLDKWKKEHYAKIEKKASEAQAAREKKEKLVEEVRREIGFKIDPRDARFIEMLEKKEKELRKAVKDKKKQDREAKLLAHVSGKIAETKSFQADAKKKEKEEEEE